MNERLLQFIWQFQYFNKSELCTDTEEKVQIIFPGHYNTDQGPDFKAAKIRVGKTIWAGNIELHIKTSDWDKHLHQFDSNYNNVILHIVWEHDIARSDIPVIELKNRVSKLLLARYERLMQTAAFIPCENNCADVPKVIWKNWKDRLMVERLSAKTQLTLNLLQQNNFHWEEVFWWLLARNFGTKINADIFESIAKTIPSNILYRHKNNLQQLEALILGQAGLLDENFTDLYPLLLHRDYQFYKHKYNLTPVHTKPFFLRMRPVNFPTIRLAQLAMLIHQSDRLFTLVKECSSLSTIKKVFNVTAGKYWDDHYVLNEVAVNIKKQVGDAMICNIIINTIIPMLFAYGTFYNNEAYKLKGLQLLEEIKAEHNNITTGFEKLGIENKTAIDSQALIELKKEYCDKHRCLECGIGTHLLRRK